MKSMLFILEDYSMKVYLEALSEQDFTTIIEWINQKDEDFIVQWAGLTYSYPLTIEQLKAHYSKGINTIESDVFIYRIKEAKQFVGTIQLCRFNKDLEEAVIGRFLIGETQNRGRGIGSKALKEIVKIGFEQFRLKAINLNVFDFNISAIRCYENIGFEKMNRKENVYQDKAGRTWNNIEMKLIKDNFVG
ncbi:GNAT family N-acetyltransferase [Paenibacillus lautus]|nr:GNAT family N-acetyltransferase [Paenibacillus lautus]